MTQTPPRSWWDAHAQAKESARKLRDALRAHLEGLPLDRLLALDELLGEALSDEYEAGYQTGYAQHPSNSRRN